MTSSFWYKLIEFLKDKKEIEIGLTIPYIIGACAVYEQSFVIDNNSIKNLIKDILNSEEEKVAAIQYCDNIQNYVVALWQLEHAETTFQNKPQLTNSRGQKRLFLDSDSFGTTETEIIKSFEARYLSYIKSKKFSWDSFSEEWKSFDQREIKQIKEIKA